MKKETLEEAAERLIPDNFIKVAPKTKINAAEISRHYFKAGANWQAERMYSEEDFKLFARQFYREIKLDKSNLLWDDLADKCFEQFKKKVK